VVRSPDVSVIRSCAGPWVAERSLDGNTLPGFITSDSPPAIADKHGRESSRLPA